MARPEPPPERSVLRRALNTLGQARRRRLVRDLDRRARWADEADSTPALSALTAAMAHPRLTRSGRHSTVSELRDR
jgi:hypothetical protein